MPVPTASPGTPRLQRSRCPGALLTVAVVFVSLFAFSAIRHPVPGRGEPYYLTKAKHYWNPGWCAGDFFLESSNPHRVFYQTIGLLTRVFSLPQTAWIGRGLALLLLASGWTALIRRLIPGRFSPVWVIWIYLGLAAVGNFAGEWIVGGVEAKVFAYALVFWSLALLFDRSWKASAVCAGLAVSFHPIVGLWSVAATVFAGSARWLLPRIRSVPPPGAMLSRRSAVSMSDAVPGRSELLISMILFVLAALPGLIPALMLLGREPSLTADYIEVYYRLAHHLDPMAFPSRAWWVLGTWTLAWLAGWMVSAGSPVPQYEPAGSVQRRDAETQNRDFFYLFVVGSLLIAGVGMWAGFRSGLPQKMPLFHLRTTILKFYPFRLADAMLPIAIAVATVSMTRTVADRYPVIADWFLRAIAIGAFAFALVSHPIDRIPIGFARKSFADWVEVCRWVKQNTPRDAEFITPAVSNAFNWYAERRQYVSFKDCPQDAPGIVEWNRRLRRIDRWRHNDPFSAGSLPALRQLQRDTGATYLIYHGNLRTDLRPIFDDYNEYRVYRLPRDDVPQGR